MIRTRLFIPTAELEAIYEKVSRKEWSTFDANDRLEALASEKRKLANFIQMPAPLPEKSKPVWLLNARLWLALRSPTWNGFREYQGACDPMTVGCTDETIRRCITHIQGLQDNQRHSPRRDRVWVAYLERGEGVLAARLPANADLGWL